MDPFQRVDMCRSGTPGASSQARLVRQLVVSGDEDALDLVRDVHPSTAELNRNLVNETKLPRLELRFCRTWREGVVLADLAGGALQLDGQRRQLVGAGHPGTSVASMAALVTVGSAAGSPLQAVGHDIESRTLKGVWSATSR